MAGSMDLHTVPRRRPQDNFTLDLPDHAAPVRLLRISTTSTDLGTPMSDCSFTTNDSQCEFVNGRTEVDEIVRVHHDQREIGSESSLSDRECGIGICKPICLQKCANIKMFVFVICLLAGLSGTLTSGYVNSVITTIERRFEIGSSTSGLLSASQEFGALITVTLVSYLGSTRHIPHIIGTGAIFMGTGAFLFSLPHFIADMYTVNRGLDLNITDENICHNIVSSHVLNSEDVLSTQCVGEGNANWIYVLILILAQVMTGSSTTPIYTLGTVYVDDHVVKESAPSYIAPLYAMSALGPVLGFGMGALLLEVYVDVFTVNVNDLDLSPSHPQWVGAWWAGFVIVGTAMYIMALPFFAFPKTMSREKEKLVLQEKENRPEKAQQLMAEQDTQSHGQYGRSIKDFPKSALRLIVNPVYMITCLGVCCEVWIVSGFIVFLPKYLETQFGISKSQANLFTGGIAIPGAVFGVLVGGLVVQRFKLSRKGALQMALSLNVLALAGFGVLFFLGCDNLKFAGATLPYMNSTGHRLVEANLTSSCNQNCDCSENDLEPICGINGMTYFSACHAGCTQFYSSGQFHSSASMNYSNCACILGNTTLQEEVVMAPLAWSGTCKNTCNTLLPFMFALFFMTFCTSATQMPLLMLTMRSVAEEERSFCLGLQFVILRLFGYIPAPIMFGNVIDTTCLLWRKKCNINGNCLIYDIENFRYKYIGVLCGVKIIGLMLFFLVWVLLMRQLKQSKKTPKLSNEDAEPGGHDNPIATQPDADAIDASTTQPAVHIFTLGGTLDEDSNRL